jgi:hypothetical protein
VIAPIHSSSYAHLHFLLVAHILFVISITLSIFLIFYQIPNPHIICYPLAKRQLRMKISLVKNRINDHFTSIQSMLISSIYLLIKFAHPCTHIFKVLIVSLIYLNLYEFPYYDRECDNDEEFEPHYSTEFSFVYESMYCDHRLSNETNPMRYE